MRPIALDTNAYVAFKRGDGAAVELLRCADHLLLSVTVLGELLAGFSCGTQEARNREELSRFLASPRVELCASASETADAYAQIYRDLRRKGRPIPSNDIWIAASCLERGALLFSFDRHFEEVDGLRLIRSWAEALP
jgi:tRNA(fMet)-specific endonuclease VapC